MNKYKNKIITNEIAYIIDYYRIFDINFERRQILETIIAFKRNMTIYINVDNEI